MKVVIRTDSSIHIGTGHLMRCLTLAQSLRQKSVETIFICRELPGNLCDLIESKGFTVDRLPYLEEKIEQDQKQLFHSKWLSVKLETDLNKTLSLIAKMGSIDWLIVDHYALDFHWENPMRSMVKKIMVIDDLADRQHDCDVLLDQNLSKNLSTRYQNLVPVHCQQLLGPAFSLVRDEFKEFKKNEKKQNENVKKVFIFFGGMDTTNQTEKALKAVKKLQRDDIIIDVVVGIFNSYKDRIQKLCMDMPNTFFYCQIDNMASLMSQADLAIGSGGTITWERCFLGLPTIAIICAQNQASIVEAAESEEAVLNLGWYKNVTIENLSTSLNTLLNNPHLRSHMSNKARKLVDGLGSEKVSKLICRT